MALRHRIRQYAATFTFNLVYIFKRAEEAKTLQRDGEASKFLFLRVTTKQPTVEHENPRQPARYF